MMDNPDMYGRISWGAKCMLWGCSGEEYLYQTYFSAFSSIVNAVQSFTFMVDLELSHDCPKWQLLRSQSIPIVLNILTMRNKHSLHCTRKQSKTFLNFISQANLCLRAFRHDTF